MPAKEPPMYSRTPTRYPTHNHRSAPEGKQWYNPAWVRWYEARQQNRPTTGSHQPIHMPRCADCGKPMFGRTDRARVCKGCVDEKHRTYMREEARKRRIA